MKADREPDPAAYAHALAGFGARQRDVLSHAIETFGSYEKAQRWLERPNALLGGVPLDLVVDQPETVDDELTRIDHGIYA